MNYVKQAMTLSADQKAVALDLYKEAVKVMVHKDYVAQVDDAHTELSAIFGVEWLLRDCNANSCLVSSREYAAANVAFNYANLTLGAHNQFFQLAKQLVKSDELVNDSVLAHMDEQMNCLLTHTV